jgi:hypothetical protein
MEHRCLIHTMADAHTWLSPLFGNLWEGAKGAAAYMAKFREANFALLKEAAFSGRAGWTFSPYKVTTRPLGYFQVAAGSLPYKANFFHNALLVNNSVAIDLFNYTQEDKLWGDVLNAAGLKINDTLRLYIMLYNTETQQGHIDVADIKLIGYADTVIGEQLHEEIAIVSFRPNSYAWVTQNNKPRGFQLYLQDSSIDWEHTVVMTMCVQTAKQGGRSYNSNGYLWHYYEHIVGMHFREAVETYPNNGDSPLSIPQADEDLYVDLGLPSGLLWATRNIDVTQKNGFAKSPYQYGCSFFSWGNIDGHNPTSNSSFIPYNWGGVNAQEPWYDGQPYGSTKGNTLTGNITVGKDFDAARANLGAPWRMPTNEEYGELFANIKYINADGTEVDTTKTDKRVIVNGIIGLYIQSKINGARLFVSCSGRGNGSSWSLRGTGGNYWSSSISSRSGARCLGFNSGGVNPQGSNYRYNGFAVRAVMVPSRGRKSVPADQDPIKDEVPTK